MRALWVSLHRYAGLAIAAFLIVAGLTGSVIAFAPEIDAWLNPQLFQASVRAERLALHELSARAERADSRTRITFIDIATEPGESAQLYAEPRVDPATGKPFELDFDEVFMDPATGAVLGRRMWGACCLQPLQLVPFLYKLHYSLHIPGSWGLWLMGGIAILWVIDNFIGAYLTLPRQAPRVPKWKRAWLVRTHAGTGRLNFDLHRAGGLWSWVILLALAVSSVALNLRKEVFEPVVNVFSSVTSPVYEREGTERPIEPAISFDAAVQLARAESTRRGWGSNAERVYYSPSQGFYGVRLGEDDAAGLGNPWVYIDGRSGGLVGADVPGEGTAGDVFVHLQFPLHSGRIAGLTGRIVICITGIVIAMLSITGILVWLRKRESPLARQAIQPLPSYSRSAAVSAATSRPK
jgi:uncharacterized iron-regulated membrane protein